MDIANFFQNIDKNILYNILKKRILDKKVLNLLKEIIYSNVTTTILPTATITIPSVPL